MLGLLQWSVIYQRRNEHASRLFFLVLPSTGLQGPVVSGGAITLQQQLAKIITDGVLSRHPDSFVYSSVTCYEQAETFAISFNTVHNSRPPVKIFLIVACLCIGLLFIIFSVVFLSLFMTIRFYYYPTLHAVHYKRSDSLLTG